MKKKYKILILILIISLFLIGIIGYLNIFNQNQIQIGGQNFKLPNGYYEGSLNDAGDVNLTNGYNTIFIACYDGNNTSQYVEKTKSFVESQNFTPIITNFTFKNIYVDKLTLENNTQYSHYWFKKDNKIFDIYTWDGNNNMDKMVSNLIESITN